MIKQKFSNVVKIKNVFPKNVINKLNSLFFKESEWKLMNQVREKHYSHIFKSKGNLTPDAKETYYAKFYRSFKLQENKLINNGIEKYILPILKKMNIKFKK